MTYGRDFLSRLGAARGWWLAQFAGTAALIGVGLGWTQLPDKHVWQVGLTLVVPVLLAAGLLALEAGTMRRLAGAKDGVRLWRGALWLVPWIALFWLAWLLANVIDDHNFIWASYVNSKFAASARARWFTYEHLLLGQSIGVWILRWIVAPGLLTVGALATAVWGRRAPWRRVGRVLIDWRWWAGVAVVALAGELLPSYFFNGTAHGSTAAQIARVMLKVGGAYVLGVGMWMLALAWLAVLLCRGQNFPPLEEGLQAVPVTTGLPELEDSAQGELPPNEDNSQ